MKRALRLDYEFHIQDGESDDYRLIDIQESNRGSEDPRTFILTFYPEHLEDESAPSIRRHLFHEIGHAITWPLYREAIGALKHVPDKALRQELAKRIDDACEVVVYEVERKLGPRCFPGLPWKEP